MTQQANQEQSYLGLHNLVSLEGARKRCKRVGRGESSGWGKTSGRGHKGQKSRKSGRVRLGFEGGQNPLSMRLPKRGFRPLSRSLTRVINLKDIQPYFQKDAVVDSKSLVACGLLSHINRPVKLLAQGDVECALEFHVHAVSAEAQKKIEARGGRVQLIQKNEPKKD